jgi:hypothetical protein
VARVDASRGTRDPQKEAEMGLFKRTVAIEQQLSALAQAGIVVNPGVTESDLTTFKPRAELERKPFAGLVEVLGIELEREPFTPICDRLWMCDFERVEDHGAYRDVVLRLERMTGQALKLSRIEDHVDVEAGTAWVEFDARGERIHWELRVEDDWLDPQVFVKYDALLERVGSPTRLYMNETDYGQVAFLAAFTSEQMAAFDKLTKIELPRLDRRSA